MKVLALETSGRYGSLAALTSADGEASLLQSLELPRERRTAQTLLPTLEMLLDHCGWEPTALDLICVASGPGSFTGLRIGVTTAKTMAYASGAQLVEVNTLAAMAAAFSPPPQRVWCLLDAQRQELFAACFPADWRTTQRAAPATDILTIEQLASRVLPGDTVSGEPLKQLADRLPAGAILAESSLWSPTAEIVGMLGVEYSRRGESVDPLQLVPRYYRRSAAEEKAAARDNV